MKNLKIYLTGFITIIILFCSCSGGNKVDAMLDSYEEYVTEYVSYMKKASNGDMSALSKYPELLEKSQDLSTKIKDCKEEMTNEQWSRFNEISAKMLETIKDE